MVGALQTTVYFIHCTLGEGDVLIIFLFTDILLSFHSLTLVFNQSADVSWLIICAQLTRREFRCHRQNCAVTVLRSAGTCRARL